MRHAVDPEAAAPGTGREAWQRVLALTEAMGERIELGDWDAFARLADERRAAMPARDPGRVAAPGTEEGRALAVLVDRIVTRNRDLVARIREARDAAGGRLKDLRRGRAACRAYGDQASLP